ncbi:MAG: DUF1232 domain-containing protein [Spirochaetia bacterium]|nr:DUF1232 domain-containing protein [Spirochaetia bacterium]
MGTGAHQDFYKKIRSRITDWVKGKGASNAFAEYLLAAPDLFHLMVRLSLDKEVPPKEKARLGFAIAYFIVPIDLMPEGMLGPLGFLDDVALAAYVLNSMLANVDPAVIDRHWAGDRNVLELIEGISKKTDDMVGRGLWKRLRDRLEKRLNKAL